MDSKSTHHHFPVLIYLLFFCSGLASLICEVVWFKQLQFVLGSSTFSVSAVVACFFGGLAFGSWLVGTRVDRWSYLLRAYALLELGLSLASATVTLILANWARWIEFLAPWMGQQSSLSRMLIVLFCFAVLIVPTTLMGSTLPVLAKHLTRSRSHLAERIGMLYAVNTLGGATGCALVGFVLIAAVGVIQSALIAAAIYLGIALLALGLDRLGSATNERKEIEPTATVDAIDPPASIHAPRLLLLSFGLMGFASIAYEVLWFRLLTCFGIHTVFAFAGMLSTYLLGLVLGAWISARYLAPHKDRLLLYLARTQLLVALAAMLSLAMLGKSRTFLNLIVSSEEMLGVQGFLSDALVGVSPFIWLCMLVLLVPTTLIGISFPLATELTTERLAVLGSRLGALYGLNTASGVVASLLTGFVLLPLLGSQLCFVVIVVLNVLLFALLIGSEPGLRRQFQLWREGGLTVLALAVAWALMGNHYLKDSLTRFEGGEVLSFRESADATFVVMGYESEPAGKFQQLLVNGSSYANNSPPGRRYMSTLGHLPALLHAQPKSAMVIAIGTGTTVGSLTLHPSLEEIWAVDIARDVFEVAPYFVPLNHRFTASPRVREVVGDGRHVLLSTARSFDVLTFEPPPPPDAGVVNLYSQEFYQLARKHMKPGAILCQWMPLENDYEVLPRMMIQTLMEEFPHVSLWLPNNLEAVAIASEQPLHIDLEKLRARMAVPELQADLSAYGLGEPEQLLGTFIAADEDLRSYLEQAPLVTDNRPRIEYFSFYPRKRMRFALLAPYRRPVEKYLTRPPRDPARLAACQGVIPHICTVYELSRAEHYDEARTHLRAALLLDPENRYLHYLHSDLEATARTTPVPDPSPPKAEP